jgi:hypothetical protein
MERCHNGPPPLERCGPDHEAACYAVEAMSGKVNTEFSVNNPGHTKI